ncbi:MAG: hypothetical protein U5Q44_00170 [Dehalococcoidia bacterium]|nr:hypothetical protein [Dehalococcoidia bacterium]
MAVNRSAVTRRLRLPNILVALSLAGAMLAILPIAAGIMTEVFGTGSHSTAFASAPSGDYAVYIDAGEEADQVMVAPADNPEDAMPIAEVGHLPGFSVRGAVSPDGTRAAVVAVEAGTPARPGASLLVVDLESGEVVRAATGVDHLQQPAWTPDGDAVVVTRGGDSAPGPVTVLRVDAAGNGEEVVLREYDSVLGVYPVGFDGEGGLVSVVITDEGSMAHRDGEPVTRLSSSITRDWALSPDGERLAFVETSPGSAYTPRVASLDGSQSAALAQSGLPGQALGATWSPDGNPAFGFEPDASAEQVEGQGVLGQSLGDGFDVPLGYSKSGDAAAVRHWSGDNFDSPGDVTFQVVTETGRADLPGATGFLGWAAR